MSIFRPFKLTLGMGHKLTLTSKGRSYWYFDDNPAIKLELINHEWTLTGLQDFQPNGLGLEGIIRQLDAQIARWMRAAFQVFA